MSKKAYKAPGVYIEEVAGFPNSVVPVKTAVPAFIGYTPQAIQNGNDCAFLPTKINSFLEFQQLFCFPEEAEPVQQYSPQYYLVKQDGKSQQGHFMVLGNDFYSIVPDAATIYYLFNSVKMFFQNGGNEAYIVSVGNYGRASGTPLPLGNPLVNPNVQLAALVKGLESLRQEKTITMYICPEATLLSLAENGTLIQQMLLQNSEMQTAISIFDIIGGNRENPQGNITDIEAFRNNTGTTGLSFGTAYYPFLKTILMGKRDLNYTNLFGGDVKELVKIIPSQDPAEKNTIAFLKTIYQAETSQSVSENHRTLLHISPTYNAIISNVLEVANIIPASGSMAGVITMVDNSRGVWKAPANVSISGVTGLPIQIDHDQQEALTIDAVSGISINAIRSFIGTGVLVWGSRTLAGNDNDWRYINVRRTMTFIEQSCKNACKVFVFEPNDANTWAQIRAMLENFLGTLWRQGALAGSTPEDAYFVECGLGTTMTAQDVLDGQLFVSMGVAVTRPAEFVVITFAQKQMVSP